METMKPRSEVVRKATAVLETSSPEIQFRLAPPRGYIPREGYFYPRNKPEWDGSVAPRYELTDIDPNEVWDWTAESDDRFKDYLGRLWGGILETRQIIEAGNESHRLPSYRGSGFLNFVAFAPTTEQLFRKFIAPEIKRKVEDHEDFFHEEAFIAVPAVSYLFPFWSQEELDPVRIVEGNLPKLIKKGGQMDRRVRAVYLDYPPNQLEADDFYTAEQLITFINQHRYVLFVVDQANLYYRSQGMNNTADLMLRNFLLYGHVRLEGNVIVTNTTTKSGASGCAVAAATTDLSWSLRSRHIDLPSLIGFDDLSLRKRAISVLHLELPTDWIPAITSRSTDTILAFKHRQIIQKNRETVVSELEKLFPNQGVICPELVVEGARIIVNAKKVGFPSAQELCKFLYEKDLGTKPASIYASPTVKKEWDKYLQITVPWNDGMLDAFINAFAKLKEINDW